MDVSRELVEHEPGLGNHHVVEPISPNHKSRTSRLPRAGLSQAAVAQPMGTTQSVVAQLEGGRLPPSVRTVQRFAQAVGGRGVVRI